MNLRLNLTHWLRLAASPSYRRHVRAMDALDDAALFPEPGRSVSLVGGQLVHNVHPETACAGNPCCIHNPSDHHMAGWRQNWRDDRRLMERICPHGIGHPDPDHIGYLRSLAARRLGTHIGAALGIVHGCDGCCTPATLRHAH